MFVPDKTKMPRYMTSSTSFRMNDRTVIGLLLAGLLIVFIGSWFSQFQPERQERALRYEQPVRSTGTTDSHAQWAEAR